MALLHFRCTFDAPDQSTCAGSRRRARVPYNTFLVGTGLSLVFGVAGGMLVELGDEREWAQVLVVAAGPVALSLGMIGRVRRR